MNEIELRQRVFEIIDIMQDVYVPELVHGLYIYYEFEIAFEIEKRMCDIYVQTGRAGYIKQAFDAWRSNIGQVVTTQNKALYYISQSKLQEIKCDLLYSVQ